MYKQLDSSTQSVSQSATGFKEEGTQAGGISSAIHAICLRCQLTLPIAQDARAQREDDTQSYDRHTQGTAAHVHALHLLLTASLQDPVHIAMRISSRRDSEAYSPKDEIAGAGCAGVPRTA